MTFEQGVLESMRQRLALLDLDATARSRSS
jgi:hypothetical protein